MLDRHATVEGVITEVTNNYHNYSRFNEWCKLRCVNASPKGMLLQGDLHAYMHFQLLIFLTLIADKQL